MPKEHEKVGDHAERCEVPAIHMVMRTLLGVAETAIKKSLDDVGSLEAGDGSQEEHGS